MVENTTPSPPVVPEGPSGGWSWSGFATGVGVGAAGLALGIVLAPVVGMGLAAGGLIAAGTYAVVGAASLAGGVATGASIYEAVNGQAWSWNGDGRELSGEERSQATGQAAVGIAAIGFGVRSIVKKGGRLGSPSTRHLNSQIAGNLEQHGWKIINGGGKLPEEYIAGPGGARRGSSYPDITATKNGKTLRVNTIDTRANGITPTTREADNMARIRSQRPNDTLIVVPK